MDDANIQVKDSAAWTLGRVCEHVPEAVLNEQYLLPLLKALVGGLKGEPRVATNVCWVCLFCGFYKSIILCTHTHNFNLRFPTCLHALSATGFSFSG